MVLLSITPLLDGVLRRDIIAPFHTSGPPLLQFHLAIEQWGKSTGQTTTFPIAFTVSALNGFTQYNETGNATGNADQTITSLSKTSITTYRGYGYNYWVIGH